MFCTKCGKQLNEGQRFCTQCGWKVEPMIKTESDIGYLVLSAQAGNTQALENLIARSERFVNYNCMKMLRNREDAMDVTQEIFINVYKKLSSLKNPNAYWGWLKTMTVNYCKNQLCKSNPYILLEEDSPEEEAYQNAENEDAQLVPDQALDNRETENMVLGAINELPETQKMCVIMYYYDEMKVSDISTAIGVSEGTIKSRLFLARKQLKEAFQSMSLAGAHLYGITPVGLMAYVAYFLKKEAQAMQGMNVQALTQAAVTGVKMTAAASSAVAGSSAAMTAGTGTAVSAGTLGSGVLTSVGTGTAAGVGAGILHGIAAKIVVGVLVASVVAGGGILTAKTIKNHKTQSEEIATAEEIEEETSSIAELIETESINAEETVSLPTDDESEAESSLNIMETSQESELSESQEASDISEMIQLRITKLEDLPEGGEVWETYAYEYNTENKVIHSDYSGQDHADYPKHDYEYDTSGNMIYHRYELDQYPGSDSLDYHIERMVYNESGQMLTKLEEEYTDKQDGSTQLLRMTSTTYAYDSHGNLYKEETDTYTFYTLNYYDGALDPWIEADKEGAATTINYYENGILRRKETYDLQQVDGQLVSGNLTSQEEYDSYGEVIYHKTEENTINGEQEDTYGYEREFDAKGKLIRCKVTINNVSASFNFHNSYIAEYIYDEKDQLIADVRYQDEETKIPFAWILYTYDEKGNKISETSYFLSASETGSQEDFLQGEAAAYQPILEWYYQSMMDIKNGEYNYPKPSEYGSCSPCIGSEEALGYLLMDIDGDGTEEFMIGASTPTYYPMVIMDLYTLVDGSPVQVAYSIERGRLYMLDNHEIYFEGSSGAFDSSRAIYELQGTDLILNDMIHSRKEDDDSCGWYRSLDPSEYPDEGKLSEEEKDALIGAWESRKVELSFTTFYQ